jgi:phage portal protein BeeE
MTPAEALAYYRAQVEAGRRRHEPQRETQQYARRLDLGSFSQFDKRPLIKPTPANLRMFGKTPYARRAIKHIKDQIANLSWEVGPKKDVEINSELQRQIDVGTSCLQSPNHEDTFRSWLEAVLEDGLICGGLCWEHEIGGDQARPLWMWTVDALSIQINPRWSGSDSETRYFQSAGYGSVGGIQGIPLRNDEVVYARVDPSTDNPFGLGPLEVAFDAISQKLAISRYAGNLAGNAQPENFIVFENMADEQVRTMRAWWRNEIEGQGQTPLIGMPQNGKAQLLKLRGTDDKALFIEYQDMKIREIATAFGLSPMTMGIERDVNRNTSETTEDRDWQATVVPMATLLSSALTRETINRRLGFSQLEFRFLGLIREDEESQAKTFELEYKNNAATPNEYRVRHNRAPLESEWGDMLCADVEIAQQAARGAGEIDDPNLKGRPGAGSKATRKGAK